MIFTGRLPQHRLEDRSPRQKHDVVVSGAEVWTDLPDAPSGHRLDNGQLGLENPADPGVEEMCVEGLRYPRTLPAMAIAVQRI
ncbi:hypothetical protein GCM10022204_22940 [Microlunatus aurantiacus]|uniref:Uncharacterized protein n=2 Tax=Microlunatus aurantiacus TaxID=446786 RepID=A0ABP7DFE5_9ACTN